MKELYLFIIVGGLSIAVLLIGLFAIAITIFIRILIDFLNGNYKE